MTNKAGFLFLVVLINAIHTYALPHDTIDEFIIPLRGRDNVDATVIKGQGAAANNVTTLAIVLRGFEECEKNSRKYGTNVDWKNWIIDGFKEHDTMSMGQWVLRPNRNSAVWGYRVSRESFTIALGELTNHNLLPTGFGMEWCSGD